jgi:hypothetical protein
MLCRQKFDTSDIQVAPHTNHLAFSVDQFGIGREFEFLIKSQHPLVMFDVRVYSEEAGGTVVLRASAISSAKETMREPMPLYFCRAVSDTANLAIFMAGMVLKW